MAIPPFGYLNIQFFHKVSISKRDNNCNISNELFSPHKEASYVTFDLSVPRGTSFGLYARRNALPTHTHYNFMEVSDMKKKQIVIAREKCGNMETKRAGDNGSEGSTPATSPKH